MKKKRLISLAIIFQLFLSGCSYNTKENVEDETNKQIDDRQLRSRVFPTQTAFTSTLSCLGDTFDKETPLERNAKNTVHPRFYSFTVTDIKDRTGESGQTGETSLSISGREQIINSLAHFGQHRIVDHDESVMRLTSIIPIKLDESEQAIYLFFKELFTRKLASIKGENPSDKMISDEFSELRQSIEELYNRQLQEYHKKNTEWLDRKQRITNNFVSHYLKSNGHHNSPPPHNELISSYLNDKIGPEPVTPDIMSLWKKALKIPKVELYNELPDYLITKPGLMSRVNYIITGAITEYQENMVRENLGANLGALNISNEARSVEVAVDLRIVKADNAQIETDPLYNKPLVVSFRNTLLFWQGDANLYYLAGNDLFGPNYSKGITDPTDYAVRELMEAATSVLLARLNGASTDQFNQCIPGELNLADKDKMMDLFFMINRTEGASNAVPF